MSKLTKKPANTQSNGKPVESTTDDLVTTAPKVFEGLFTAWGRMVPELDDNGNKTGNKVPKFKCTCTIANKSGEPVDVTAWVSTERAKHFGITEGAGFIGKFAYQGITLVHPKGEYNEERSLTKATLISVVD